MADSQKAVFRKRGDQKNTLILNNSTVTGMIPI